MYLKRLFALTALLWTIACTWAQQQQPFTTMEKSHIRIATPMLFAGGKELLICSMDLEAEGTAMPLPNGKIISPFGKRGGRMHSGIDIKARARDTIYCAFDGIVRMARTYSGYGLCIVVRHPSGIETVYSHNSKNLVKSGDSIKAGTPIALVGRTGRATTDHLHFETRINGQTINPALLFDFDNKKLQKICLRCYLKNNTVVVEDARKEEEAAKEKTDTAKK